ncbi:Polarized growth protein rax2 [Smittium mucronatum]|uniref:Polarized growth protein rax2 n=1 Tax=Smittium mucronatum TaxID=133383 RepID=A0A1R0H7I2_9FUNG|nr:Polarized growth protein rax2 [Smittium mucronatum]
MESRTVVLRQSGLEFESHWADAGSALFGLAGGNIRGEKVWSNSLGFASSKIGRKIMIVICRYCRISLFYVFFISIQPSISQLTPSQQSLLNVQNETLVFGSFDGISSNPPTISNNPLTYKAAKFVGNQALELGIETAENQVINSGCTITLSGVDWYVFGGFFSTINNSSASNIFAKDSRGNNNTFLGGVNGPVNSVFCDNKNSIVWLGGNFTKPNSVFASSFISSFGNFQGKLIGYDFSANSWLLSPWKGLDGDVLALNSNSDSSIIWVGGNFNNTVDDANHSSLNAQPVNIGNGNVVGGNSFLFPNYSDPNNAVCTGSSSDNTKPWLMRDGLTGFFDITFSYPITPTLIRIKNSQLDGRGTQSIRVQSHQNDTALELSYIDPVSNLQQYCTNACPLLQSSSVWQEFSFHTPMEVNGLKINIASFYGAGGGFDQVEIYQRDAVVYGNPKLNFPSCATTPFKSEINTSGSWVVMGSSSTNTQFIKSEINPKTVNITSLTNSITAFPYISDSGFYDVYLDIPSCNLTNDCSSRTSAQILLTTTASTSGQFNATIDQKVTLSTAVLLYTGYIPQTTTLFRPSIKLSFDPNSVSSSQESNLSLIFERVRFVRRLSFTGLNGIFGVRTDSDLVSSIQPPYGTTKESLPNLSIVRTISSSNNSMIFGGSFDTPSKGIAIYRDGIMSGAPNGGLDGYVYSSLFFDNVLYAGGYFHSTFDNSTYSPNIISLNFDENSLPTTYSPISGISGPVNLISTYAPYNHSIAIGGLFSTYDHSISSNSQGVALYNTSSNEFISPPLLGSGPTAAYTYNNYTVLVGSFTSIAAVGSPGIAKIMANSELSGVGSYNGSLVPNSDGVLQVNAVTLQTIDSNPPILVAGGLFNTKTGSQNVAYLSNNQFTDLGSGVNGEVLSLASAGTFLFIGGIQNNKSNGFSGISIWNMKNKKYERSPPQLSTTSSNPDQTVVVNAFAVRPGTSTVVIGGNFDKAGSISCPAICTWDINEMRWSPISSNNLNGVVNTMKIINGQLYIGGLFNNGTNTNSALVYDFNSDTYTPLTLSNTNISAKSKRDLNTPLSFPGPVRQIAQSGASPMYYLGDDSSSQSPFIYSSSSTGGFIKMDDFSSSSKVNSISIFHSNSESPSTSNYTVVALGDLTLKSGVKTTSAALLNGNWVSYLHAIRSNGSAGVLNSIVSLMQPTPVDQRSRMKTLWVVFIALAISLFIVFLTVLAGLIYIYYKNRSESSAINSSTRSMPVGISSEKKTFGSALGPDTIYKNASPVLLSEMSPVPSNDYSRSSNSTSNSSHSVTSPFIPPVKSFNSNQRPAEKITKIEPLASGYDDYEYNRGSETGQIQDLRNSRAGTSRNEYINDSREDLSFDNVSPQSSYESDSQFYKSKDENINLASLSTGRAISKSPMPFFNQPSENTKVNNNLANKHESTGFLKSHQSTTIPMPMPMPNNDISTVSESTKFIPPALTSDRKSSILQSLGRDHTSIRNSLKIYPMYYAKFTFSSRENGELGFIAGDRVFVIDKSDEIWWMGIVDPGKGLPLEQGLFPATYVSSEPPSPTDYDH